MQKTNTKSKALTAMLLFALVSLAFLPLVHASAGFIVTADTLVPAGGDITLDFGATPVTWSGGQFYLLLSADGFSQVSASDIRFTPSFSVDALKSGTPTTITDPAYLGSWTLGGSVITGSIPLNIAGGKYYIKAFDGAVTSLAVTSTFFTVTASFRVKPTEGGGLTSIVLSGYAFPANALVNITYLNPLTGPPYVTINNLTQSNALGQFNYTMGAPDLKNPAATDDNAAVSDAIEFQATENKTAAMYTTDPTYAEWQRGLLQIGAVGGMLNATGIFGNSTDFSADVAVPVNASVRLVGNWFAPGNMTLLWDNSINLGVKATNGTGFFNTTVVVPITSVGLHNITMYDQNNVKFVTFLAVTPTLLLNPNRGPVGTTVTATGYGFAASSGTTKVNATIAWPDIAAYLASALTDASGSFTVTFNVPTTPGGATTVTALQNDTGDFVETATATFTVTATFTITPSSFANNATIMVTASGTGFIPASDYLANIDNVALTMGGGVVTSADNGTITLSFVGAGFIPGVHILTMYLAGTNIPAVVAPFTVLSTGDPVLTALTSMNSSIAGVITSINNGLATITTTVSGIPSQVSASVSASLSSLDAKITGINDAVAVLYTSIGTLTTDVNNLNATLIAINGNVATVQTSVGTLQGTITSIQGNVATVQTNVGALQASLGTLQSSVNTLQSSVNGIPTDVPRKADVTGLSTAVWIAVVFAIIAAIAAIACIVLVRQKVAG